MRHLLSSAYYPQGNSMTEGINQTIKNPLKIEKGNKIKQVLQKIKNNFNLTYHSALKKTSESLGFKHI